MKYSVVFSNNETYRITITSSTDEEKKFLEQPISEIKQRVYQYFDQAVKNELGENASISSIADDSGFPYEIYAHITMTKEND
jgi:hypothetical protein